MSLKAYYQSICRVNDIDPKTGETTSKTKFIYWLSGDPADMASYRAFRGKYFDETPEGFGKWFASEYVGSVADMMSKVDSTGKTYWFANTDHKRGQEALLTSLADGHPAKDKILADYMRNYCTFVTATPPAIADAPVAKKPAKPAKPAKVVTPKDLPF